MLFTQVEKSYLFFPGSEALVQTQVTRVCCRHRSADVKQAFSGNLASSNEVRFLFSSFLFFLRKDVSHLANRDEIFSLVIPRGAIQSIFC